MQLKWPLPPEYRTITTPYGENGHMAVDIYAPEGTSVLASHSGVMTFEHTVQGGVVARVTGTECYTRYCHLSGYWVDNGQQVKAGDEGMQTV